MFAAPVKNSLNGVIQESKCVTGFTDDHTRLEGVDVKNTNMTSNDTKRFHEF